MSDPTPSSPNQALEEVLLRYNLSPDCFHKLRADSYERMLAGSSVEQLDLFYALLLDPKLTNEERAAQAPYWPKGSDRAGEPPSERTVRDVRRRMFREHSLTNLGQVSDFIDHMRQKLGVQSSGNQAQVVDTMLNLLGEELLTAKLDGGTVSEQKDIAELLVFAQAAKDKATAENRKLALKERDSERKEEELKLAKDKFERETCELFLKWHKDERAKEIANSNISNETKILQLRQTFFADVDALQQSGKVEIPPV